MNLKEWFWGTDEEAHAAEIVQKYNRIGEPTSSHFRINELQEARRVHMNYLLRSGSSIGLICLSVATGVSLVLAKCGQ